jgi:proteasome lid subunit RPN8/RPN11
MRGARIVLVTLVLTQNVSDEFAAAATHPLETAGVLLARVATDDAGHLKLLARSMHWVADDEYVVRSAIELRVTSQTYIKALAEAEENSEVAIWVHTHPNGYPPEASEKDAHVDEQIAEVFRIRTGAEFYGSLILSSTEDGFSFTGKIQTGSETNRLDRILTIGDRWKLRKFFHFSAQADDLMFDRNVRAFGPTIQNTIGDLTIAVVGCGGTGSAVAEQLVRLGVRKLLLIDPDTLTDSNITRVYGSTPADVGRPKVEVLRAHLTSIAPSLECRTVQGMITSRQIAPKLMSADIVFGCSDDNAGRMVLSRLSTYFIIPVIDCGVLLASDAEGRLTDINGRVTTMVPGAGCMICRGRVDLIRARTELLLPEERVRLENEGYAPTLGRAEPAVVTFTTSVAAFAVTEMLERLIGFGAEPRPTELLIRFHEREISTNLAQPVGRHFCNPQQGKIGKGVTEPFLEQVWA